MNRVNLASIAINMSVPTASLLRGLNIERIATMPENVPPKETAAADALNPKEQAPGVPRAPAAGPASVTPPPPGAPAPAPAAPAAPPPGAPARAPNAPAAPAADDHPGEGFVRIKWVNKIGGHEADEEWAEERRARNLVGSGHAEIVEKDKGKK